MALEGLLQEFGLADILQLIYFQKKTGVLNIVGKLDNIDLGFVDGFITSLKSQRRLESNRLGKILVHRKLLSQEDLDNAIETQKTEGVKIGNLLVRNGKISKDVVMGIIQEQIIETIVQIFHWKEGRYEFIPQGVPVDKELPLHLDTQHLLMDGLRIVDEWSLIEGRLDLNYIYKQIGEPETSELSDIESEVLGLIDESRDVVTIINISGLGDFETAKAILSLEEKEIIEPVVIQVPANGEIITSKGLGIHYFLAVYIAILFVLMSLFKSDLDSITLAKGARTSFEIEKLKKDVDIFHAMNGLFPQSLDIIAKGKRDSWGRPFVYKFTDNEFRLFSPGIDGIAGTEDYVY
jgi:chromosome segregation and condensation protein ScpB